MALFDEVEDGRPIGKFSTIANRVQFTFRVSDRTAAKAAQHSARAAAPAFCRDTLSWCAKWPRLRSRVR
jgi:hypothetical protein